MSSLLGPLTFPEVAARAEQSLLVVPIGSTEQHGPHLPLSTDTDIAAALCAELAAARPDVIIAPAVPYGASGEHAGFAGTLSIGQEALELLLVELVRSATETFSRVLLVSAHGGNAEPVTRAVDRLRAESRDVRAFSPRWSGDPHAGAVETSLMLSLEPQLVRMDRATVGDLRPLAETLPLMRVGGVRAVTSTGVLGDPTGASAAQGDQLLAGLAAQLRAEVEAWVGAL